MWMRSCKANRTLVIFIWRSLNPSHLKRELELPQNTRRLSLMKHPWGGRVVLPKPGSSSLTRCAPRGCAPTAALLFLGGGNQGGQGPSPTGWFWSGVATKGLAGDQRARGEGLFQARGAVAGLALLHRQFLLGEPSCSPLHSKAPLVLTLGPLVSGCSPSAPPTPLA